MKIGNLELRNRLIMSPVKTGYGTPDGEITDKHLAFWRERSKHAAAIIPEPFFIDKRVRELPTQIGIDADDKIEQHKKLTEVIHGNGALAIANLNHPGRMANPSIPGNIWLSASEIPCPAIGKIPKAMDESDIKSVQDQFIRAAIRAEKAGYDAIEIQFGLGYLIAQFLSPLTNKREMIFGGSLFNRLKFGREIIRGIRNSVRVPVMVRISGEEMFEGGITISETIEIITHLEAEGIAAVHVASGNVCETPAWYYQHQFIPKNKNREMAARIKNAITLPVIASGQITTGKDIDEILNSGSADFVSVGRALIADPDFFGKYEGKITGNIRPCSSCLTGCLGRIKAGKGLQCEINPSVGKEDDPLIPALQKKRYAVVGGGMAGMQAAKTLLERGHKVTLFEKEALGGQFNLAYLPEGKSSLQAQIEYLKNEIKDAEIIRARATPEILKNNYDGIVLATGSRPFIPSIEGLKEYSWAEVLYKTNIPSDKNVVIIGGGMIGTEIAATLINYGNRVTIVELTGEIATDMEAVTKKLNMKKLADNDVRILLNSRVEKVESEKVIVSDTNTGEKLILENIEVLIVSAGMRSENSLSEKLTGTDNVFTVGDAEVPGDVVSAVQSAYFTCKEL